MKRGFKEAPDKLAFGAGIEQQAWLGYEWDLLQEWQETQQRLQQQQQQQLEQQQPEQQHEDGHVGHVALLVLFLAGQCSTAIRYPAVQAWHQGVLCARVTRKLSFSGMTFGIPLHSLGGTKKHQLSQTNLTWHYIAVIATLRMYLFLSSSTWEWNIWNGIYIFQCITWWLQLGVCGLGFELW